MHRPRNMAVFECSILSLYVIHVVEISCSFFVTVMDFGEVVGNKTFCPFRNSEDDCPFSFMFDVFAIPFHIFYEIFFLWWCCVIDCCLVNVCFEASGICSFQQCWCRYFDDMVWSA
eukprot:Lithocolla_globosa_v1_NODE_27_length_9260_cov_179.654861.p7 type:complete len:116 gc:universal NODE_27_length_9260_cov_179.654861:2485-2138(-)